MIIMIFQLQKLVFLSQYIKKTSNLLVLSTHLQALLTASSFDIGIDMQTCRSLPQETWQRTRGDTLFNGSSEMVKRIVIKS